MNLARAIEQLQNLATHRGFDLDASRIFRTHGDFARWHAAFEGCHPVKPSRLEFGDIVTIGLPGDLGRARTTQARVGAECGEAQETTSNTARMRTGLASLRPWRKGPFAFFGITVDSEWRSDWKWRRVTKHLADLTGRHVLDVGCGNGYYGWRMLEAGATDVVGCDPTLNSVIQHLLVSDYVGTPDAARNLVLPLRLEDLPERARHFDTVFSMGVLYHQRNPQAHLTQLGERLRPGGELVVESLIVPGAHPLVPRGRYARMRNIHVVPNEDTLVRWIARAGLVDVRVVDVTVTTIDEQRSTEWMPFHSLASALASDAHDRTIEGHPAPTRAIVVARRPE